MTSDVIADAACRFVAASSSFDSDAEPDDDFDVDLDDGVDDGVDVDGAADAVVTAAALTSPFDRAATAVGSGVVSDKRRSFFAFAFAFRLPFLFGIVDTN
jgi:hypothetical protein